MFPNNANQPLVIARQLLQDANPVAFEKLFEKNGWPPSWRSGIFDFDHCHSTAHEVPGCYQGSATLHFGGGVGVTVKLTAGDAVIIPAGVAHRCVSSNRFICVGAYPVGQSWDTCYGKSDERPAADERTATLGVWPQAPPGPELSVACRRALVVGWSDTARLQLNASKAPFTVRSDAPGSESRMLTHQR